MGSYLSAEWNSKSWQNPNFCSVCYTTLVFLRSLGVSCGSLLAQQQLVTEHVITAISAKEEKDSHGKINDCCRKQLGWAQYAFISYWQECLNILGVFFLFEATVSLTKTFHILSIHLFNSSHFICRCRFTVFIQTHVLQLHTTYIIKKYSRNLYFWARAVCQSYFGQCAFNKVGTVCWKAFLLQGINAPNAQSQVHI